MPTTLRPINDALFVPPRDSQSKAEQVRRLVEFRHKLINTYGKVYGGIADSYRQVRDSESPVAAQMTAEQRNEIEHQLLFTRDELARGFTQAIARAENNANELAPGTFPRDDEPIQSFDLGEWVDKILNGLISILDGLGDIFDAFGWDFGEAVMRAAADGLRWLDRAGRALGWWGGSSEPITG
ncbi:MAG: hypothetical protein ACRBC3_21055 [Burkholderiaceae bacterium]